MPASVIRFVDGKARTHRASRIRATTILDTPVERPEDFDLATFWRESSAEFRAALPVDRIALRVAPQQWGAFASAGASRRWSPKARRMTKVGSDARSGRTPRTSPSNPH